MSLSLHQKASILVGTYGTQGCGMTELIDCLKKELGDTKFGIFEDPQDPQFMNQSGLETLGQTADATRAKDGVMDNLSILVRCRENDQIGIVANHITPSASEAESSFAKFDNILYTHVLFLDVPEEALERLDNIVGPSVKELKRVLVFAADKTLADVDARAIVWEERFLERGFSLPNPLKQLFDRPQGDSYRAFRQATWLYEEIRESDFDRLCDKAAGRIEVHPEFEHLLEQVREKQHVRAIVVTSCLKRVWEGVLRRKGFHDVVEVIGGGRISDGFVVNQDVKVEIVTRLRKRYGARTYAFGNNEVDTPMLRAADEAFDLSGNIRTRNLIMARDLPAAITNSPRVRLMRLTSAAPPLFDLKPLPIAQLDANFIDNLGNPGEQLSTARFTHATDITAAKLITTPMRDARVTGVALREAYRCSGWWTATQFVSEVIGLEEIPTDHSRDHSTHGGEPMSLGVRDAFPSAMVVHANTPNDLEKQHIVGQRDMILFVDFIKHIRQLNKTLRIVVVAGVARAKFFNAPPELVANDTNVHVVGLRLSDHMFEGRDGDDTASIPFDITIRRWG